MHYGISRRTYTHTQHTRTYNWWVVLWCVVQPNPLSPFTIVLLRMTMVWSKDWCMNWVIAIFVHTDRCVCCWYYYWRSPSHYPYSSHIQWNGNGLRSSLRCMQRLQCWYVFRKSSALTMIGTVTRNTKSARHFGWWYIYRFCYLSYYWMWNWIRIHTSQWHSSCYRSGTRSFAAARLSSIHMAHGSYVVMWCVVCREGSLIVYPSVSLRTAVPMATGMIVGCRLRGVCISPSLRYSKYWFVSDRCIPTQPLTRFMF